MEKKIKTSLVFIFLASLIVPLSALAHQPRIVGNGPVIVTEPEISKAYYGQLNGEPQSFTVSSDKPFHLYVNVLVPDIAGQKKDVSAMVIKDGNVQAPIATLDGVNYEWKKFFEPFGHDTYWMGPEYRADAGPGTYEIRVWSSGNDSKYSLAIGETEAFGFKEGLNALALIPQLKQNFFNESPANFILSPFGYGEIIVLYLLAAIFGFVYRAILKRFAKNTPRGLYKNIGKSDRVARAAIGAILIVLAITTSWNPIIIFLSGFCFFEAVFSWCGFYAAIGKNTCPIE